MLVKLEPGKEGALFQERVLASLKTSRNLPPEAGGGSTAMVACQRQLHQSSRFLEDGLGLSYHRVGRLVMPLGICTEGEHLGKVQLTILNQAQTVITNLDADAESFDPICVQAMLTQMAGLVTGEEQDLVKAVLESKARVGLPPAMLASRLDANR